MREYHLKTSTRISSACKIHPQKLNNSPDQKRDFLIFKQTALTMMIRIIITIIILSGNMKKRKEEVKIIRKTIKNKNKISSRKSAKWILRM
jgi:hypothetical protein